MFPNRDPKKIRPLDEEMSKVGLNPERTIGAMERNLGLLEQSSLPRDISGLPEGSDVPRSIHEAGAELLEDAAADGAQPPAEEAAPAEESEGEASESAVDTIVSAAQEGEDLPEGIVISEEELKEAFKIIRKMIKTAGQKMKAKRSYRKVRSKSKKYAKQYYKRFKRKISKVRKRLRRRFGGEAGLKKARQGGKKRISTQTSGIDSIANIREEFEQAKSAMKARQEAAAESEAETQEPTEELPITPYEEAVIKAGLVLMYVGECFEEVDVDSAAAMYDLSDGAADLSEEIRGVEVIDEETEVRLESLFLATAKAMKAHYEIGAPTFIAVSEAIELVDEAVAEGDSAKLVESEGFETLSEKLESVGVKNPEALTKWIVSNLHTVEEDTVETEEE